MLVCVILPVLFNLGFWQLDRAEEKRELQKRYAAQESKPPLTSGELSGSADIPNLAYRRVILEGRYLQEYTALLDNQIVDGRPGYHVVTLFNAIEADTYLWINRGWIPGNLNRELPAVPPVSPDRLMVQGSIYIAPGEAVLLSSDDWSEGWPVRVQSLDMARLSARAGEALGGIKPYQLFSHSIRLDREAAGALDVDWQVINTRPEKHTGYAVQWFAMALALFIFWLFLSFKRR